MQKGFTLAVVGIAATVAVFALSERPQFTSLFTSTEFAKENSEFANFLAKYGKSYGTKEEFQFRFEQFQKNLAQITHVNSNNENTFSVGLNKFADYTPAEYRRLLGYKKANTNNAQVPFVGAEVPTSVDWRDHKAVNAVQDQQQCGSCWAFSAIGALEGRHAIKSGELLKLSEQQLVDCDRADGNAGCNGGDMGLAFQYAVAHKIELETSYPYTGQDGKCVEANGVVTDTGAANVKVDSSAALKEQIAQGPVSVAIEADTMVFQFYSGGIFNSKGCGTELDHGVVAVGYGVENGKEFYIVRNSWGPSWGEKGYIRIAVVDGAGICGIQSEPVVPTL